MITHIGTITEVLLSVQLLVRGSETKKGAEVIGKEVSGTISARHPAGVDGAYFVVEGGDVLALDPELASSFGGRIVRGGILDLDAGVVINLAVVNGLQEAGEARSFADDDVGKQGSESTFCSGLQRVGVPESLEPVVAFRRNRSHEVDSADAPVKQVHYGHGPRYLQDTARERRNVFEALMDAVKTHSLGQISHALGSRVV